jgi:hypothetical protein
MDSDRGPDGRAEPQLAALASDTDQQLDLALERMGNLCSMLTEEIVLFDYLKERKLRLALAQEELEF